MSKLISLSTHEHRRVLALVEALGSASDLQQTIRRAGDILFGLIPADHSALCLSRPELPGGYEWATTDMPPAFFAAYAEMAPHDFVRGAVGVRPNVVLRDEQMIARRELERSMLYRRCREVGMPIEQVMAVMLAPESSWNAGLILYRDRMRPFSARESALLQCITPIFTNAVRTLKAVGDATLRGSLFEQVLLRKGVETIIFTPAGAVLTQTTAAGALLARWFSEAERGKAGVPEPLLDHLRRAMAAVRANAHLPPPWVRSASIKELRVSAAPLRDGARILWALVIEEVRLVPPIPPRWSDVLTSREVEVVERVLRGWDNALIAEDLKCSLETVKKHLYRIFNKLGVSSSKMLIHLAHRPDASEGDGEDPPEKQ